MAEKLSPQAAKAAVDTLYKNVADRWVQVVTRGEFMSALAEGKIGLTQRLNQALSTCIRCRACTSVCPIA